MRHAHPHQRGIGQGIVGGRVGTQQAVAAVAAHHHQLAHGNGEVDTTALGQVAQQAGAGSTAEVVHLLPVQPYAALVGQLTGEHPKQRDFAATVVAHHGHKGRRGDAQKKVADQHPTGVARNQILHAKRSRSYEC